MATVDCAEWAPLQQACVAVSLPICMSEDLTNKEAGQTTF